ncbi:MAG: RDD family protein [Thermomicrobiales bacterium]
MSTTPPAQPPSGVPPYVPPPYSPQPSGSAGFQLKGSASTFQYAGIGTRFLAVLIDGLIVGIPLVIIAAIFGFFGSPLSAVLNAVVYFLYEGLLLTAWNGQTIGKKIMSVRVVSADGQPLTTTKTFTRAGVKAILSVVGSIKPPVTSFLGIASLLDYLWPFWDANKQTWHDKAAGTYVVQA